jgi:hypothetical protein
MSLKRHRSPLGQIVSARYPRHTNAVQIDDAELAADRTEEDDLPINQSKDICGKRPFEHRHFSSRCCLRASLRGEN